MYRHEILENLNVSTSQKQADMPDFGVTQRDFPRVLVLRQLADLCFRGSW